MRKYRQTTPFYSSFIVFLHSNCKVPGIAGLMEITTEHYPDHTQFDKKDVHYDPRADKKSPIWFMVDVKYKRMLKRYISLSEMKLLAVANNPLRNMALFKRSRLSVQPVTKEEFEFILALEDKSPEDGLPEAKLPKAKLSEAKLSEAKLLGGTEH